MATSIICPEPQKGGVDHGRADRPGRFDWA